MNIFLLAILLQTVGFSLDEVLHDRVFQEDMCVGGFLALSGYTLGSIIFDRVEEFQITQETDSGFRTWTEVRIINNPKNEPYKILLGLAIVGLAEHLYIKPDYDEARGIETGAFLTLTVLILNQLIKSVIR